MSEQVIRGSLASEASVGTRLNWGAILAGGALTFGFYLLFGTLGAAVGLSASDRLGGTSLHNAAVGWVFVSTAVAFLVGGLVTTVFTLGENQVEGIVHGVIMWALVILLLVAAGATGTRSGFTVMMAMTNVDREHPWELAARNAGVAPDEIERVRRTINLPAGTASDSDRQLELRNLARRVSWYVFGVVWLSMFCAGIGAWLGTGRTFRVIAVAGAQSIITTRTI
jgi:hypothetical protein